MLRRRLLSALQAEAACGKFREKGTPEPLGVTIGIRSGTVKNSNVCK